MARIRTIKPEFWKDEELSELPEITHLFAAALLNYSDDEGYFNANPALIKAELFPLREPSRDIHGMLTELSNIGYLRLFRGSKGKTYGLVVNFEKHQKVNRPTPSKIKCLIDFSDDSVIIHGCITAGKEQGTGKGKEQGTGKTTLSGKPSEADSPLPAKSEAQDDTPVRVIEYLNDKAKRKFPAKGKNLTLVKARIAEGATFEQLTGVVDLKCHAWLNDPKMHEFIRPATLFGQEKFAQYVGQLGMPRPKTKAEELDEAFGLAPAADQAETMGDVFEGAWKEVFGDRL